MSPITEIKNFEWIPEELRDLPNWIEWRLDEEDGKVPFIPGTDKWASVSDPTTWRRFEDVQNIAITNRGGIGFVLGGEAKNQKFIGIDLDGCLLPDGSITEWARKIIHMIPSYREVTPSGTGLRIWCRGNLPLGDRMFKLNPEIGVGSKVQVEVFDEGKYFTVTGAAFEPENQTAFGEPNPYIENIPNQMMMDFYQFLCELRANNPAAKRLVSGDHIKNESVELKCVTGYTTTKLAVLMEGKIISRSPFIVEDSAGNQVTAGSQSECDLSLCTALALKHDDNFEAIDTEFRKSALFRDKWEKREDYRENTIHKAIESALRIKKENAGRPTAISPNPMAPSSSEATGHGEALIAKPEDEIPPFDPSVINGIYAKFVEVVTRGTTLAPQYAFAIAKTIVGIRMAGKVRFENLDVEPRYYTALIGETGSGKGESWRRAFRILQPEGSIDALSRIKIIDSADSGAGLKDLFFESPQEYPVLCFIDEVADLGNKSKDTRNPAILDTVISLADSTTVSRVLSKRNGGSKSMNGARLGMVMCGQDGSVYMKSFAGRTKLGLWDRFYPEYGVPQETGDLPSISIKDAMKLLEELNSLDYSGTMDMSAEAKTILNEFWDRQPAGVRRKARWKKNLQIDAFMSAFGRGLRTVEAKDMKIAIRIFTRQLVIRQVCFTSEVPDKTGYYIGLIKVVYERMRQQINAGVPLENIALTRRNFEAACNAYRDNELHYFRSAWDVFAPTYLARIEITGTNGHRYQKFVPSEE